MREHVRRLALRQPVIHRSVEVIRDLRHLARGNESADRDQAPVPRRQPWAQPKITEKDIGGVLHNAWRDCAEILLHTGAALLFGSLIQRQEFYRCRRKLIGANPALMEYLFGDNDRRHRIVPARVERKMSDNL